MILILKEDDTIKEIVNDCGYKAINCREFINNILNLLIEKEIDDIDIKKKNNKIYLTGVYENIKYKVILSEISSIYITITGISISIEINNKIAKKLVKIYG